MRPKKNKSGTQDIIIIGDGFSEKIYFESLKTEGRLTNFKIIPELPEPKGKGGTFVKVFKKAETELAKENKKIFCLIDMDTVYAENKEDAYQARKEKLQQKGEVIYELNPCFEIWILLHYLKTARAFTNCDDVERFIKKNTELKDYNKTQEYHTQQNFYKKLRLLLESNAVPNARFLEQDRELQSQDYPRSEVYKLFYELGILK